jgi:hypothetical protein
MLQNFYPHPPSFAFDHKQPFCSDKAIIIIDVGVDLGITEISIMVILAYNQDLLLNEY